VAPRQSTTNSVQLDEPLRLFRLGVELP
jgi:hypothetical protein